MPDGKEAVVALETIDRFLERRSKAAHLVLGAVLLAIMGTVDILTGAELSFSLFYLIPIALITWYAGFGPGALAALAAALIWLGVDRYDGLAYSYEFIPYWNMFVRLGFFLLTAYLLARLQQELRSEEALARTDPLTGLANARHFRAETDYEIHRGARYGHPFTAAYIDLDNFKAINDNFGHLVGDQVLREVSNCLMSCLRRPDVGARLGGDEFVVLLPETGATDARMVLDRLQEALRNAMRRHAWPVTFSIGAMTFVRPPESVDEVIRRTDRLMYKVKASGKNDIYHITYGGPVGSMSGPAARNVR